MSESTAFSVGDSVVAVAGMTGTIADIRKMANGDMVYAVVDTNGTVRHFVGSALKLPL